MHRNEDEDRSEQDHKAKKRHMYKGVEHNGEALIRKCMDKNKGEMAMRTDRGTCTEF
jgi:hypothetical protein